MSRRLDTTIIAALAALAASAAVVVGCSTQQPSSKAWQSAPDTYKTAISDAVALHGCDSVDRDLVAAQTKTESDFGEGGDLSPAGAVGPAQLPSSVWNKVAPTVNAHDPRDPGDAMAVLVAHDCDIASTLNAAHVTVNPEMIAAAYNSGTDAVITNPTNLSPTTREYAQQVVTLSHTP